VLAGVLTAMLIGLTLWAVSYRQLSGQIQIEERLTNGAFGAPNPGAAQALAAAIQCYAVNPPAYIPYQCRLVLGKGTGTRSLLIDYTHWNPGRGHPRGKALGAPPGSPVFIKASPYRNENVPDCPSCQGGPL
jgi:hypothetical protein